MKPESECGVGRKAEPLQKPEKFLQRLRRQESASFGNQDLMVSTYEGPRRRCNSGAFLGRHSSVTSSGVNGSESVWKTPWCLRISRQLPRSRQAGRKDANGRCRGYFRLFVHRLKTAHAF